MSETAKSAFRVLIDDYLEPLGLSLPALAKALRVSDARLRAIMVFNTRFDADLALRLSRYFGNSPEFWMKLRVEHNLAIARRKLALIEAEVEPCPQLARMQQLRSGDIIATSTPQMLPTHDARPFRPAAVERDAER